LILLARNVGQISADFGNHHVSNLRDLHLIQPMVSLLHVCAGMGLKYHFPLGPVQQVLFNTAAVALGASGSSAMKS